MPVLELATPSASRVLLVEDSEFDARLIRAHLEAEADEPYDLQRADRLQTAQEHLTDADVDCVLLDLNLPDASRLEALAGLLATAPDVPVVVLSGTAENLVGSQALVEGAQDYLHKAEADGRILWRAIRYAIERKRAEVQLRYRSLHCPLTGLPNRVLFIDRLEVALSRLDRQVSTLGVLVLDLDGFRWVNDRHGHEFGDALLQAVARRLDAVLGSDDTAARYGGDEFLLLTECPEGESGVLAFAERIARVLDEPVTVLGEQVVVSASIGVATASSSAQTAAALLRDADSANHEAKRAGKRSTRFFNDALRAEAERRVDLVSRLHRARELEEFRVHYQPIVELSSGQIAGWEALLRWQQPEGGLVGPASFIDLLEEEDSLITPVGGFVLSTAATWLAEQHRTWAGPGPLPSMSVNLSAMQLRQHDVVERIARSVSASGVAPELIWLELTESQVVLDDDEVTGRLHRLRALGVRLSMDDYGTGYSTLAQLRRLPFDALKIDRSFVAGLGQERDDEEIVRAVVAMGASLQLRVVAEGIETRQQARVLTAMGCPLGQGYLLGRPTAHGGLAR